MNFGSTFDVKAIYNLHYIIHIIVYINNCYKSIIERKIKDKEYFYYPQNVNV